MTARRTTFGLSLVAALIAASSTLTTAGAGQEATGKRPARLVARERSLGKILPGIVGKTLAVSPDSKRVAYDAQRGQKWLVVVDGVEGKEYDGIGALLFSRGSKRVAYAAKRGQKWLVVVDGFEGKEYGVFLRGSRLVFDGPDSLHDLAHRNREFFLVEIQVPSE